MGHSPSANPRLNECASTFATRRPIIQEFHLKKNLRLCSGVTELSSKRTISGSNRSRRSAARTNLLTSHPRLQNLALDLTTSAASQLGYEFARACGAIGCMISGVQTKLFTP